MLAIVSGIGVDRRDGADRPPKDRFGPPAKHTPMTRVVTCFLRHRRRVLLVRRSDAIATLGRGDGPEHPGRWDAISGRVDDTRSSVEAAGRRTLRDAIDPDLEGLTFVREGRSIAVDESDADVVQSLLFETDTRDVAADDAFEAVEWVDPTELRTRETVPWLGDAWRRVAPTVETVRTDRTHGSAWIAARALEVLRDAAAAAEAWDDVAAVARDLRGARPGMAAVATGVDRVIAAAGPIPADPGTVATCAIDVLDDVLAAGEEAGETAAARLREADTTAVATLSRSATVRGAVASLSPDRLVVAESRPEREGVGVAEWAAAGTDAAVTLTTEAGLPTALTRYEVDAVLVGADAIAPGGDVVNKTGTRVLTLAARDADIPVYVAASTLKIRPAGNEGAAPEQASPTGAVYDGDADMSVHAPAFETVPGSLVDGVATEDGVLDREGVRAAAETHADNATWAERTTE